MGVGAAAVGKHLRSRLPVPAAGAQGLQGSGGVALGGLLASHQGWVLRPCQVVPCRVLVLEVDAHVGVGAPGEAAMQGGAGACLHVAHRPWAEVGRPRLAGAAQAREACLGAWAVEGARQGVAARAV